MASYSEYVAIWLVTQCLKFNPIPWEQFQITNIFYYVFYLSFNINLWKEINLSWVGTMYKVLCPEKYKYNSFKVDIVLQL